MVVNVKKIYEKMKNINWLSIEKNKKKRKKCFIIIARKYLDLENFAFL